MADLMDQAGANAQQATQTFVSRSFDTGVRNTSRTVSWFINKLIDAITAVVRVVTKPFQQNAPAVVAGQVSLKQFTKLSDGKREVVNIIDQKVAREFRKELNRHGILWSVEHRRDGSSTFHVQGKDAALVQHALERATSRVDVRLAAKQAPQPQAVQQAVVEKSVAAQSASKAQVKTKIEDSVKQRKAVLDVKKQGQQTLKQQQNMSQHAPKIGGR